MTKYQYLLKKKKPENCVFSSSLDFLSISSPTWRFVLSISRILSRANGK